MAPRNKAEQSREVQIIAVGQERISVAIVGTMPFICNRVSGKAPGEFLVPAGKKNAAEKSQNVKHDVFQEYRNSPYTLDSGPTLLAFLATAFKRAMMTAALDMPGTKKAQIGRLVRVEGERLPLYGVPKLLMSITRCADIARTPDMLTRAILPQWAMLLNITYPTPHLREKSVINLLAAAGLFAGVGDWRTEKGAGNYGSFRLAGSDDAELKQIMATGGRNAQIAAINTPACYDDETEALLEWYRSVTAERGLKVAS